METDTPETFARAVAERLAASHEARGDRRDAGRVGLVGVYLHGSAVLGGWVPTRSDVDLLVVVTDWSPHPAATITEALLDAAEDCPGTGLECSVVTAEAARAPAPPWPYLLHVASTEADGAHVVDGRTSAGDADLLMHYAVTRAHGRAVLGPPQDEVCGAIDPGTVLAYLRDELAWGLDNGSEPYVVLNALRALRFARDGALVSKVRAGEDALHDGAAPRDLVLRSLAAQRGLGRPEPVGEAARLLVRQVHEILADRTAARPD